MIGLYPSSHHSSTVIVRSFPDLVHWLIPLTEMGLLRPVVTENGY